ncbi:MAG: hypothetical protein ACOCXN_12145 [Spirochaetota bacterium]
MPVQVEGEKLDHVHFELAAGQRLEAGRDRAPLGTLGVAGGLNPGHRDSGRRGFLVQAHELLFVQAVGASSHDGGLLRG